jgi:hypothetical protein
MVINQKYIIRIIKTTSIATNVGKFPISKEVLWRYISINITILEYTRIPKEKR